MKFEPWLSITIIIENCPSAVSEYLSCQQNFSYGILIFISFRLMMRSAYSHQSSYRIFLRHIWT